MLTQTRQAAERAKDELNGVLLKDVDLKIGWGKAVVLPPMPLYTASGAGGLSHMIAAAKQAVAQVAPAGQIPPPGWSIGQQAPEREADPHAGRGASLFWPIQPNVGRLAKFPICYVEDRSPI